jgi:L-alanine-DL-glutamate epimerase-like enolase superfamily enzyme
MGYPAFKIHGWGGSQVAREVANIAAVRKAVGPNMVLMIDPACELTTWADAWTVGRACDDARFFWLEDPYQDGGISRDQLASCFAHLSDQDLRCRNLFVVSRRAD